MALTLDGARDRWDRMNASEQRLVLILGTTIIVGLIALMVGRIQSGMDGIEKSNTKARKALRSLAVYRNAKAKAAGSGSNVTIPEKAVELDSYLENIVSDLSLTSPTYPALKTAQVGIYEELSFEVEFKALSIEVLSDLLEKIESGSKLVIIKELVIDTNFRDKEKLDLEMTVATFKAPTTEKDDDKDDGDKKEGS